MPIFEYRCPAGHLEEKYFRVSHPYINCETCGQRAGMVMSLPAPPRMNGLQPDREPQIAKTEDRFGKVYSMDFGKTERNRLDSLAGTDDG